MLTQEYFHWDAREGEARRLVTLILEASPLMPDRAKHAQYLETLSVQSLRERLEVIQKQAGSAPYLKEKHETGKHGHASRSRIAPKRRAGGRPVAAVDFGRAGVLAGAVAGDREARAA